MERASNGGRQCARLHALKPHRKGKGGTVYKTRALKQTWVAPPGVDHTPYRQHLDRMYAALADPSRRRILHLIGNGMVSPARISEYAGVSPQTVCHHVKVLREAALVELSPVTLRLVVNKNALAALRDHMQHFF